MARTLTETDVRKIIGDELTKLRRQLNMRTTTQPVRARKPPPTTTPSTVEMHVLLRISFGMRNSEIADDLDISENTVKTHVSRLLSKCNARDRSHLVRKAFERGLLNRGDVDPYPVDAV